MNTGRHVVRNKKVYAIRDIDPKFLRWLEERTEGKLTKLTVETPPGTGFWRWKLGGIKDKAYGNYSYKTVFREMIPELEYIFGEERCPLRVVSYMSEGQVLGLDFRRGEDLFQRVDPERLTWIDTDDFIEWREERYPPRKRPDILEVYKWR